MVEKRIGSCIFKGFLILVLLSGFFGSQRSFAQQEDKAIAVADQFLKAVVQGDSPGAFELCSSGVRRGKSAENFLESAEIAGIFAGTKSWEIIKVLGKGSIKTVLVKLTNKESEKVRTIGVACLKMRGSYRVRNFSTTPWVASEARFFRYLSDLYERLKDIDSAEQAITKAYSLDPKDPKVSAFLGYIYLQKGVKMDEARELIEAAHEQMPEDPEFMDFMGWFYHKTNKRQETVHWLDMAREAFKKIEGHKSSPEYIRFSSHVAKAKASGWRPTQT